MILVTGATGLVGSHLIKELSGKGEPVLALYNKTKPSEALEKLATWKQVDISVSYTHLDVYKRQILLLPLVLLFLPLPRVLC